MVGRRFGVDLSRKKPGTTSTNRNRSKLTHHGHHESLVEGHQKTVLFGHREGRQEFEAETSPLFDPAVV